MKGGIGQLMKQAQQMQADMQKAQEEMSGITVTGESGGGAENATRHAMRPRRSGTKPARSGTGCSGWSRRPRSSSRTSLVSVRPRGAGGG